MSDEPTVYLYGLVEPETRVLLYVGQSQNPYIRLKQHTQETSWLLGLGIRPELVIFGSAPESMATRAEQCLMDDVRLLANDLHGDWRARPCPNRGTTVDREQLAERRATAPVNRQWSKTEGIDPSVLTAFRAKHGISQAKLAGLLGVHYSAVSLWETGRRRIPKHIALALKSLRIPALPT